MRLALSGKMVSGKSLVSSYLVEHYGFTRLAFADKIKELANMLWQDRLRKRRDKDRWLLIQIGERMREIDPTVWIRYILEQVEALQGHIVIDDMRFPHEYNALKEAGFALIRMNTDRAWQLQAVADNYPDMPLMLLEDYTEKLLDNKRFDYIIKNTTVVPLHEVYSQVDAILLEVLKHDRA